MERPYKLEIYQPGGLHTVWESFESDQPFMAIVRGDIVNPGTWEGSQSPMFVLRVVGVEHLIWESPEGQAKHKIMVYTKQVSKEDAVPADLKD